MNTNVRRAPRVQLRPDRQGQDRAQGVLRPLLQQLGDGFSSANPGGTSYVKYNFNDLNQNGKYDGPSELGALRIRLGGADAPVDPNTKTPYTEEFSGIARASVLGRVVDPRAPTCASTAATSSRSTSTRSCRRGTASITVPHASGRLGRPVFNLLDVPSVARAARAAAVYTNIPDSDFTYDTIEVAFNKRFSRSSSSRRAPTISGATSCGRPTSPTRRSTSPLTTDPIGVGIRADVESDRAEPSEDDDVSLPGDGTVHVRRTRSASPSTTASRAASPTRRSSRTATRRPA